MSRTDTIKDRAIYVYLHSVDQKERWEELAEENGMSVSKFVVEQVERGLEEPQERPAEREELEERIEELEDEVGELRSEKRVHEKVIDRLEEELRDYRTRPFRDQEFAGTREYSEELIGLLRSRDRPVGQDDILDRLGIDPAKEPDAVEGISSQLDSLRGFGLVKSGPKGWRWVGDDA